MVNPSLDAIEEISLLQNTYDAAYGRSAGAPGERRRQVGHAATSRAPPTNTSATRSSTRATACCPTTTRSRGCASISSAARSAARSAAGPSFFFANVEGIDAHRGRHAAGARADRRPSARGDFSASRRHGGRSVHAAAVRRQRDPGVAHQRRRAPRLAGALSDAEPRRRRRQLRVVAGGRAATRSSATIKTDHHGWRDQPIQRALHLQPRRSRPAVPGARSRNLPGFGVSVLDQGHQFSASAVADVGPRCSTRLRVGFNALDRENLPQSVRRRTASPRSASSARRSTPSTTGIPPSVVPGYETLGDDHQPAGACGRRGRCTCPRRLEHRPRPAPRQARRRAAALPVGRLQPPVLARPGDVHRRLHRPSGRRPAARLPDVSRCSPPTTTGRRCGPGRPTSSRRTTGASRRRLTLNAGVRYEYNAPPVDADDRMADLRRRDAAAACRWARAACRARASNGDFNNVAPRVGVSWDLTGRGTLVLRGGYGIFYDSGTLIENSALYFNPPYWQLQLFFPSETAPIFIDESVPDRRRVRADADRQHARPAISAPAIRSRRASALERAFTDTTLTARYVGVVRPTATCASATSISPSRDRARSRSARPIAGFGDILLRRVAGDVALSRAAAERRAAVTPRAWRSAAGYTLVEVDGRHVGVPRHRRRRQHAAEQPRLRRRVGPVGLRRAASAGGVGDVGRAVESASAPAAFRATGR